MVTYQLERTAQLIPLRGEAGCGLTGRVSDES
jgi:hypothetical protein